MRKSQNSVIRFQNKLSVRALQPSSSLLIYDQRLKNHSQIKKLILKFPLRYPVKAGESLKDIQKFPAHVTKILKLLQNHNQKDLQIVGLGGGSVGDFTGFFASIFKRGTKLALIPTTWLAALDSSHGGKNGLNAASAKNQIGTFYVPDSVYIVRDILKQQPQELISDATGELLKIALIHGGSLWRDIKKSNGLNEKQLWKLLPLAVKAKYQVVQQDPLEKKGHRQILNLGHTLGHVIESRLGVSHGVAVGQGLVFATEWSYKMGFLKITDFKNIAESPLYGNFYAGLSTSFDRLKIKDIEAGLKMDKKKNKKDDLIFIFPVRPGTCLRQNVKIKYVVEAFTLLKKTISA